MAFAVLSINTTLSATMEDIYTSPNGTYSFTFSTGVEEDFFVLDDDATFNDGTGDANQIVAPASTIFLDNTPVASRQRFDVTPDNGDPIFTVYVVFENTTSNDDFSAINTLDYALISETPLIAGVNYSISNHKSDATVNYSSFSNLLLCFARGTRIATVKGERRIETLAPGDLIQTMDHGIQPIRWIGSSIVLAKDKLAPIHIAKGAWQYP